MPYTARPNSKRELQSSEPELPKHLTVPKVEAKTPRRRPPSPVPSTSKEIVYDTSKQGFIPGDDEYDVTEEEAETEEEEACPLRSNSRSFLGTQYGIRKDGEQLIGNSLVFIHPDENITIKGTAFRDTEGLWELLTRKNVNKQLIGKEDLRTYENIDIGLTVIQIDIGLAITLI